jgi:hypothetical protein
MKMQKKVSLGVAFARKKPYEYEGAKYDADVKDGDIVTILDEGKIVVGQYGEQHVFKIKTRNGERGLTFNQKSINNLIDSFGEDSVNWVGKEAKIWVIKAMVSGKLSLVVYVSDKNAQMDDEGNFTVNGSSIDIDTIEYPEDEYNGELPNFDLPEDNG